MLEIKMGSDDRDYVSVEGTVRDITAECCMIIRLLYRGFKERDAETAEIFKGCIEEIVEKGVLFSDDLENEVLKEIRNRNSKKVKELYGLLKELEELIEKINKKNKED